MYKKILTFAVALIAWQALADGPVVQTTPLTRTFLRAPDGATARAAIGANEFFVLTNNPFFTNSLINTNWILTRSDGANFNNKAWVWNGGSQVWSNTASPNFYIDTAGSVRDNSTVYFTNTFKQPVGHQFKNTGNVVQGTVLVATWGGLPFETAYTNDIPAPPGQASPFVSGLVDTNSWNLLQASAYRGSLWPRRPFLGYNGWYRFGSTFRGIDLTNDLVLANQYFGLSNNIPGATPVIPFVTEIDDGFFATTRDGSGNLQPSPTNNWPALSVISGYIHSMGSYAISYQEPNDFTSAGKTGSGQGTNLEYDAQYLASQNWDGERLDCLPGVDGGNANCVLLYHRMATAWLNAVTNRPVFLWGAGILDGDRRLMGLQNLHFSPGFDWQGSPIYTFHTNFLGQIAAAMPLWWQNQPGHWITPQMFLNNGNEIEGTNQLSAWTTIGCPIIYTTFAGLTASQLSLSTNYEALALLQDPLCLPPVMVISNANVWAIARPLESGKFVLYVQNCATNATQNLTNYFAKDNFGTGLFQVRDLWQHRVITQATNSLALTLPPMLSRQFLLTPATLNPVLSGSVSSELGGQPLLSGLVFDSPLLETSGTNTTTRDPNAYTGIFANPADLWFTNWGYGPGVGFDASGSPIQYNCTNLFVGQTNMTVEAWFATKDNANTEYVFAEGGVFDNNSEIFELLSSGSASTIYFILGISGRSGIQHYISYSWGGTSENLTNGTLHQLAGTYNGATMTLYLDGAAVYSEAETGQITNGNRGVYAGSVVNGFVGHQRAWSRCLSATEISQLYAQGYAETLLARGAGGAMSANTNSYASLSDVATIAQNYTTNSTVVTSNINLSTGKLYDAPHNLGSTPVVPRWVLVCITPELGYSNNDEVPIEDFYNGGNGFQAFTGGANTTNLFLICNTTSLDVLRKDTAANAGITLGNWKGKGYGRR